MLQRLNEIKRIKDGIFHTNINISYFLFFSVRPEKPVIKMMETGESVEGYLGPYQIGSSLSLVCQVNGGKLYDQVFSLY